MSDKLLCKKRQIKRIVFILTAILSILVICSFIFLNYIYNLAGSQRINKYWVKGIENDKFYVETYKVNFPEQGYSYVVFDNNKQRILGDKIPYEIRIIVNDVYEDESIRAYELSTNAIIFYEKGKSTFSSILISQIPNADVQRYTMLRNFAQKKVSEGDWKWTKAFSEYLVKSDDKQILVLLKKYSDEEFSYDEVQRNKNSEYSKEYMKNFSKELIRKYNIK